MTATTNPESWHSRWRVVPVEPTTGMLIAGNHCQPGDYSAALVWQSMLEAAERSTELSYTRPLPQDMPTPAWRLLERGERICAGDEGLNDDCKTWSPVPSLYFRCDYTPNFFVPIRRRVATPA